jgi:hypothetical protein
MVSIGPAVEVTPHGQVPIYISVEVVGEHRFFHLRKKDRKVERLLLGDTESSSTPGNWRPLAHTTIIESITSLRDQKFRASVGIAEPDEQKAKVVRYSRSKDLIGKMLQLDDFGTITLPTIGEASTIDAKVLLTKPKSALMVEMSEQVVDYLRLVVQHEVASGTEKRKHPRDSIPPEERVESDQVGVSYSYARKQFRAYKGGLSKFFKPIAHNLGDAEQLAVECIKNDMQVPTPSDDHDEAASDTEDNIDSREQPTVRVADEFPV